MDPTRSIDRDAWLARRVTGSWLFSASDGEIGVRDTYRMPLKVGPKSQELGQCRHHQVCTLPGYPGRSHGQFAAYNRPLPLFAPRPGLLDRRIHRARTEYLDSGLALDAGE